MSTATNDHASDHGHDHDDGKVHAHVSSPFFLVAIFAALIVLTVVTVAVSYVDLGSANTFVAMFVATLKASLVSIFFMHLAHDKPFNALVFVGAFVFLGVFISLSNDDLSTRGRVDVDSGGRVLERTGQVAPGGLQVPAAPAAPAGAAEHGGGHAEEHH